MARPTFEQQLENVRDEIHKTEEKLTLLKQKETEILQAIDERDMKRVLFIIRNKKISVDELEVLLNNQKENTVKKETRKKDCKKVETVVQ